jgi:hypothetical protein
MRRIEQHEKLEREKIAGSVEELAMRMNIAVITTVLAALPITPAANGFAQTPQECSIFTIAGHSGEAHLLQLHGKSYIDIETLARLTQGTLSYSSSQTILTLPPSDRELPAPAPHANIGFSRAFSQAGIEEISVIREWRIAIVNAVANSSPVSEDWISAQHRMAEKNLALASAAAATDIDRSAYTMLSAEFNNMQALSERYLAIRKRVAFISSDNFNSSVLEDQILNCARGFVSMTESHEFQDQPACH